MKKIFISGNRASGKSSLLRIIDGNSQVGVIHHHDRIYTLLNIFIEKNFFFKSSQKKIDEYNTNLSNNKIGTLIIFRNKKDNFLLTPLLLRILLMKTAFYEIEQNAWFKKMRINFDSSKLSLRKFEFRFHEYESLIFSKIFKLKKISIEELLDIFILSYFKILNGKKYEYICFMLPNDLKVIKNVINEKFDGKIIYLKRSLSGIINAEAIRNLYSSDTHFKKKIYSKKIINSQIKKILFSKKIYSFIKTEKEIIELKSQFSKNIMLVNFNDLIMTNLKTTKKIFNFLNLKFEKINIFSSVNSFKTNEKFGKINDYSILSEENEILLDFLKKKNLNKSNILFVFKYYLAKCNFILNKLL